MSKIIEIEKIRKSDRVFTPEMDEAEAAGYYKKWLRAVERSEKWECDDEKNLQTC